MGRNQYTFRSRTGSPKALDDASTWRWAFVKTEGFLIGDIRFFAIFEYKKVHVTVRPVYSNGLDIQGTYIPHTE